ncbi:MAG: glycine oxidase ThiO [Planctomycetales bacterium]|nr:glycine oxidase ThiO [Planctomycetales bacterium]
MCEQHDVVIVGGGVIGLSIAWELANRGREVCLLERGEPGREASWAGAGMLPDVPTDTDDALEQLMAASRGLHEQWAQRLREATGIDNGFHVNGALYLARSAGERASLRAWQRSCGEAGLDCSWLEPDEVLQFEPALSSDSLRGACRLPREAQVRNPHHLQALTKACQQAGVAIRPQAPVVSLELEQGVCRTAQEAFQGSQVCVAAGPWSRELLAACDWTPDLYPVRGQIALLRLPERIITHTLNEGPRYLVPRRDGRVLAGSTEEEVGFDKSTTPEAIAELTRFAYELAPALREAEVERTWAGLRPAAFDGFPYLGRAPHLERIFVAAGHFRNGLTLSTGTAVLLAQLMCNEPPLVDPERFRVGR